MTFSTAPMPGGCSRATAAARRSTATRSPTALVGLGRLAVDLPDVIESVDVNPFVALPKGGMALDALIVLRRR